MAKPINRTDHLGNVQQIAGSNKGILYDQNGKGARQILCPKCKQNTVKPSRNGRNEIVYSCTCGATFKGAGRLS